MSTQPDVWVLMGHFKRKPSELLGVYQHYERGQESMQGLALMGIHHEVELKRVVINTQKKFRPKKAKR